MRTVFAIWIICTGLLLGSTAQAGEKTVREFRGVSEAFLNGFAAGVIAGQTADGLACDHPGSGHELAAYFRYGAQPEWTMTEAIQRDTDMRGCRVATGQTVWFEPLYQIRTTQDEEYLRHVVGLDVTDRTSLLMRMLATDRLRELGRTIRQARPTQ